MDAFLGKRTAVVSAQITLGSRSRRLLKEDGRGFEFLEDIQHFIIVVKRFSYR